MTKIFIDESAGTTGLRIYERLESRSDIEPPFRRKPQGYKCEKSGDKFR